MPQSDTDDTDQTDEVQETTDEETEDSTVDETDDDASGSDDEGAGDDDTEDEFDRDRAMAKIRKVNREAENLRRRLKEAEAAQAELKEIKDSQKSDAERLTDRASAAETQVSELTRQINMLTIQKEFDLSDDQVEYLKGEDLDALRESAEKYIEVNHLKQEPKKPSAPSAKHVSGGRVPKSGGEPMNPLKLAELVKRR